MTGSIVAGDDDSFVFKPKKDWRQQDADGNVDRNILLARKHKEAQRRKRHQMDYYADDPTKRETQTEYLCPNCGHVFYVSADEKEADCPYCQTRHYVEEASEVHVIKRTDGMLKLEKLAQKESRKKRDFIVSRSADKHENDAKTQASLQMGTPEYAEYVEDIQESNPAKPDDEFHVDLETRNAAMRENMIAVAAGGKIMGDYFERKAAKEAMKRDQHDEIVAAVTAKASYTPTEADDAKVSKIGIENPLLHDINIDVADYQRAMEEFVK